jgi:DNA-binding SARP family transcriptional activator
VLAEGVALFGTDGSEVPGIEKIVSIISLLGEGEVIPVLKVYLLGGFRLLDGETAVTAINTPRLQALLAYLALHRHTPQPRAHLAFLFWPDSTEAQARTNLRYLIHQLRQTLPQADQFLQTGDGTLHWRADAPFTLDVADFEQAIAQADRAEQAGDQAEVRATLEQAVSLYQGDLLPSCYDDWLLPERERLQQVFISALERLILLLESQRNYRPAIHYTQQLLRHDSLYEAAYRHLMRLHALNGDPAMAVRTYHSCVTLMQRELGVEPSPATREMYERLLNVEAPSPRPAVTTSLALVGRTQEWAQLQAAWRTATSGQAGCVVIAGEAGIGKTRLAEELLVWAERQGIITASARCYAVEGELVYAPVATWLRVGAIRATLARLETVWLTDVARLVPEVLVERPDVLQPGPLTERWQRQRLFESLARAALADRQPRLFLLDDLQWCDRETLEWLHYLLRYDPQAPLLLVGTMRPEEATPDHPLTTWLLALRQGGQLSEITLGPLDAAATAALAEDVAGRSLDPDVAAYLHQDTEGNPLFVVECVRTGLFEPGVKAQSTAGLTPAPRATAVPPKVQAVIARRLAQLSPPARELVSVAATIGRAFTLGVLARASDADEPALVRGLDELWQRRIVREQGTDTYDFSHDKIREVAYQSLLATRRRVLHRQVAEAMEVVFADRLGEFFGIIAQHYLGAELWDKAVEHLLQAGETARRLYAYTEVRQHYAEALELLSRLPDTDHNRRRRVDTLIQQVGVSLRIDSPERNLARLAEVKSLLGLSGSMAMSRDDALRLARVHLLMGRSHYFRGEMREAVGYLQQVLPTARELGDDELLALPSSMIGRVMSFQGYVGQARRPLEGAVVPLEKVGNWTEWISTVGFLGMALAACGHYTAGLAEGQRALARAREINNLSSIAESHLFLANIYLMGGDIPCMVEECQTAMEVSTRAGAQVYVYNGLGYLALAESRLGHHQAAMACITKLKAVATSLGGRLQAVDQFAAWEAEIALNANRVEEALTLAEQAVSIARSLDSIGFQGWAQRVWGQALAALKPPRWDEAESHLAESLRLLESGEAVVEAARTHVAWGLLCRDRHNLTAAGEHLEEAAAQFEASSLMDEAQRTAALLRELR